MQLYHATFPLRNIVSGKFRCLKLALSHGGKAEQSEVKRGKIFFLLLQNFAHVSGRLLSMLNGVNHCNDVWKLTLKFANNRYSNLKPCCMKLFPGLKSSPGVGNLPRPSKRLNKINIYKKSDSNNLKAIWHNIKLSIQNIKSDLINTVWITELLMFTLHFKTNEKMLTIHWTEL